jgi:hypothetical protein
LQRLDRGSNSGGRLIGVIGYAIDYFQTKIASVIWHQLLRQLRGRAFHFSLIRADYRVYVCGFGFGFRLWHRRFQSHARRLSTRWIVLSSRRWQNAEGANISRQGRDSQRVEDNALHLHA